MSRRSLMAWALLGGVICCDPPPEGELTSKECETLVRKRDRLVSANDGTGLASMAREGGSLRVCLKHGTKSAYRCVQAASTKSELPACWNLMPTD